MKYPDNLIIDNKSHRSSSQEKEDSWVHFILIGLWASTLPSIMTFLAWMLGGSWIEYELITKNGVNGLTAALPAIAEVIAYMGGSLIIWAIVNWIRFSGSTRRTSSEKVSTKVLSESLGVSEAFIEKLHSSTMIVIEFNDAGDVIESKSTARRD